MKTIDVNHKGKPVAIRYTVNDWKNIYSTKAQSFVVYNCKKLGIRLNKLDNDWDDCELYYRFEDFIVFIERTEKQYTQHIVLHTASKKAIVELMKPFCKKMKDFADYSIKRWALEKAKANNKPEEE